MQTISNLLHDLTGSDDIVRQRTSAKVNARIDRKRQHEVSAALSGGIDAIRARLAELDREWNLDRALMLTFATVGTVIHELEMHVDRRFRWLFRAQIAFLGLHAVAGWCPPQPVLRRLGFRTQQEIDSERVELEEALADRAAA